MHGQRRQPRAGFAIYRQNPPTADESANAGIVLGLIISAVGWFGKETETKWVGGLIFGISAYVKYRLSTQQSANSRRSRRNHLPTGARPLEYMPTIAE